jgi:hypothetical protein
MSPDPVKFLASLFFTPVFWYKVICVTLKHTSRRTTLKINNVIPPVLKVLHETNNTKIICHYPPGAPAGGAIPKLETWGAVLDVCLAHIYFSKFVFKTNVETWKRKR